MLNKFALTKGFVRNEGWPTAAADPGAIAVGPIPRGGGCKNPVAAVAADDDVGAGNLPPSEAGQGDVLGSALLTVVVVPREAADDDKAVESGLFHAAAVSLPVPGAVVSGVGLEAAGKGGAPR